MCRFATLPQNLQMLIVRRRHNHAIRLSLVQHSHVVRIELNATRNLLLRPRDQPRIRLRNSNQFRRRLPRHILKQAPNMIVIQANHRQPSLTRRPTTLRPRAIDHAAKQRHQSEGQGKCPSP